MYSSLSFEDTISIERDLSYTLTIREFEYLFDQQELSMRQTIRFGVVKGHDWEIHYHPDKTNVVTETLSRK